MPGQHFSLRQLGICEPPSRRGLTFCSDIGLPHRGFSVGTGQDLDSETQAVMSPERAMRLWGRGGLGKSSGRSSCLSSRSNSALTLTDTEHENKSDSDNGRTNFFFFLPLFLLRPPVLTNHLTAAECELSFSSTFHRRLSIQLFEKSNSAHRS